MQWPEDFDFAATRAINAPAVEDHGEKLRDEEEDSNSVKKRDSAEVSATVDPVVSASVAAAAEARELDPAALNASFRLAAWASVIMVCPLNPTSYQGSVSHELFRHLS